MLKWLWYDVGKVCMTSIRNKRLRRPSWTSHSVYLEI
jgi:hypothetical protein